MKCLAEIKEIKSLSASQQRGLIIIAYKKNGREFLKFYRPITLLNVDVKILTKTIATRIANRIQYLINESQMCMPVRHIFKNILILQDLIEKEL